MDPIKAAIQRPIAVLAGVAMVVLFGLVALTAIPIQLAPDINKPIVQITTVWPGAAPAEVEREIVNRQEEALRGLEGVREMTSRAQDNRATITLEFSPSQDMDRALLLVANRLDRVTGYPAETDEPVLSTSDTEDNPFARFVVQTLPGNDRYIRHYQDFIEDVVVEGFARVKGVGTINYFGGQERELLVEVDAERMAGFGLTVGQVVRSLRDANISLSAGDVDEGKRRYVVRAESDFESVEQVRDVVLRSGLDPVTGRLSRITVGDVADVRFDYKEVGADMRYRGEPAVAVWLVREPGANVVEVMKEVRRVADEMRAGLLKDQGLTITQNYDETKYIDGAIQLVTSNIWIGGAFAAIVLLAFLRSPRATLVVALAMPISIVGAFVAMAATGRSINVISLAGIAFAIGMVVDAAIVVLENIFRLRQQGMPPMQAAYRGAQQVWGAILVAAMTTVMAFAPILILELEVGQLFRDIAVAICFAVTLSLIVAVTVIPSLSARLLSRPVRPTDQAHRLPVIDGLAKRLRVMMLGFVKRDLDHKGLAIGKIAAITAIAAVVTYAFLPKLEYLPEGNRNWLGGLIQPPPGYNIDTVKGMADQIATDLRPYMTKAPDSAVGPDDPPLIRNFLMVAREGGSFMGIDAADPDRLQELRPLVTQAVFREPGTFGFINQPSIFGRGAGGARAISLDIGGPDLETILAVANRAFGKLQDIMPLSGGTQVRPQPGLELGAPEVRVEPDPIRLADAGLSASELAQSIDAFNDGIRIAEITVDGRRMDLTLSGRFEKPTETQGIGDLPVVTPAGDILPVSALSQITVTTGPTQILRKERARTVSLDVRPASEYALEEAMEMIQAGVIDEMKAEGLPSGVTMALSGTADQLTETWNRMIIDLMIALIIVYLVMAVLFESFWYPLLIMFAVPLATAGGVLGLVVLNLFVSQPLDMLTMLGFIILIGIVVNNAILLVHQSMYHHRDEGMPIRDAILTATENRMRPIFMSTLTSVFGMLPLVLFPGAGSELYRGLGTVVVGGLAMSALLTLMIIPPLLSLTMPLIEKTRKPTGTPDSVPLPEAAE